MVESLQIGGYGEYHSTIKLNHEQVIIAGTHETILFNHQNNEIENIDYSSVQQYLISAIVLGCLIIKIQNQYYVLMKILGMLKVCLTIYQSISKQVVLMAQRSIYMVSMTMETKGFDI